MNWFILILCPFAAVGVLRTYYAVCEGIGIYAMSRRATRAEMVLRIALKLCDDNRDQASLVLVAAADMASRPIH